MTKPFTLKPDWRYTWEDLADASTPGELHRVSYGRLLHRILPGSLPHGWGLAFTEFENDRKAAEDFLVQVKSEVRWSRLHTEIIEIRPTPLAEARFSVVVGPIGPDAFLRLPWNHQWRSQWPATALFSELGMETFRDEMGGILVEPLDASSIEVDPKAFAAYGVAGIPGIRVTQAVVIPPPLEPTRVDPSLGAIWNRGGPSCFRG